MLGLYISRLWWGAIKLIFNLAAIVLGLCGIAIAAVQAYEWLKTMVWTPYPISQFLSGLGLDYPHLTWLGAQRILDWLLDLPISAGLLLAAFVCFVAAAFVGIEEQTARSRLELAKEARQKRRNAKRKDRGVY